MRFVTGEPTRPQVPVAAIKVFAHDGQLETLNEGKRLGMSFFSFGDGRKIDARFNKANLQIRCVPII